MNHHNQKEARYGVNSMYESEIFPRLRFNNLQCCKCVSKVWFNYINTPYFIDSHLDKSIQNHLLNMSFFNPSNKTIKTIDVDTFRPSTKMYKFSVEESHSIIGSCNGLLCFKSDNTDKGGNYSFVVYNPATQVEKRYRFPFLGNIKEIKGFGFTCLNKDYKLVFIQAQEIHVYNLKSFWFESIGDHSCKSDVLRARGVSTGSVVHWLYGSEFRSKSIFSFDLMTERQFKTPLPSVDGKPWLIPLRGRLHLACNKYISSSGIPSYLVEIEIWVMKEHGNIHDSWVRLFKVRLDDIEYSAIPISLKEGGRKVLLELWRHQDKENKKSYVWYDLVTKARDCELQEVSSNLIAEPCLETLVDP